jgi:membrane glycosyltransferase
VRTAIVMPVKDESVERVFAGLRACARRSSARARSAWFDIFILSDSADPDLWVDEEEAWARWNREAASSRDGEPGREGGGHLLPHRRVRRKRKSGNVADFCRRYGRRYRYMVVLDADSVMSGDCIARLVALMERNPHVGIIQTARRSCARARCSGASSSSRRGCTARCSPRACTSGSSATARTGDTTRSSASSRSCSTAAAALPGKPPFGGDIMSHDFVEAALLGRARWSIWLAFDLPGTWEEVRPRCSRICSATAAGVRATSSTCASCSPRASCACTAACS